MKRKAVILIATVCAIFGIGTAVMLYAFGLPLNRQNIQPGFQRADHPGNRQLIDSGIRLLRTGDLVVRTGADMTSYMFTQFNEHNKTYSHCGIVIVEQGYPFIYHSIGGEDNPDQMVKRDSAVFWFSPVYNLGFGIVRYGISPQQTEAIVKRTRQFFNEKRKFDMSFDLLTDDRLYCAEFVYKAVNEGLGDSTFITPSKKLGYTFVGIDNLFLTPKASFICQVQYK